MAPWGAAAALVAGIVVREATRPTEIENPLSSARSSRLTEWAGAETQPEISADGKFVAFLADRGGQFALWGSPLGAWKPKDLTGNSPVDQPTALLRSFGFTGNGAEIWFSPKEARAQAPSSVAPKTEAKMLIPLLGGTKPRPFLGEKAEAPAWSPDGTRLAYFVNSEGDPLFVADNPTGAEAQADLYRARQIHAQPQSGVVARRRVDLLRSRRRHHREEWISGVSGHRVRAASD